ncbi:envelope stress response membrane protein PspB [Aestuariispira insulae]|uniref:Phage shock protein B n=1 Tax=Aestuariispira insulae TaxID=1461337 RepID=A0A3D9HWP3_9PROT|nr:envelope stress response membrane protein PspB [Aestuariispira insulae]RED53801.1 phage shock protein B [Aestuariispira insulae]
MFSGAFGFVLMILFLVVVAPLWIIFHFITRWKQMKSVQLKDGETVVEAVELKRLLERAERLDDRVRTLEKLLDAEAPGWREK